MDTDHTDADDQYGQEDAQTSQAQTGKEAHKQSGAEIARQMRSEWIAEHGSTHLKKMDGAGYHCQSTYVKERAALEYPGYVPDFRNRCNWRKRTNPSEKALDKAIEDEGEVVWLTQVGPNLKEAFKGECEAVVIRAYLGKYNIVTILT